jgi:MFS family permease
MCSQEQELLPARKAVWPIYYGWVNVFIAALAMTATLPGRTHGLGLITRPLLEDLRLDEETFSFLNLAAVLLGSLLAWPAGWSIDRWGTRLVGTVVTLALGVSVLLMSEIRTPEWLFVCLLLVRGLGQGALSVASMAMVGKWFARRLGPAMGVYSVLLAIGFIAATLIVGKAVQDHGWRSGWAGLAWSIMMLGAVTAWLVRSKPESDLADDEPETKHSISASDLTVQGALASPAFWIFSLAAACFGLIWSAVTLFNESILLEHDFGPNDFLLVMAILAGSGLVSNLLGGWLALHWPLGRLLGVGMLALAAALAAFPTIRGQGLLVAYALILGLSGGMITVVYFTFYGRAYGRKHLGLIQGAAHLLATLASALGPVLLTWSRSRTGSYDGFFLVLVPIVVILALAGWWAPMPGASERRAAQAG